MRKLRALLNNNVESEKSGAHGCTVDYLTYIEHIHGVSVILLANILPTLTPQSMSQAVEVDQMCDRF